MTRTDRVALLLCALAASVPVAGMLAYVAERPRAVLTCDGHAVATGLIGARRDPFVPTTWRLYHVEGPVTLYRERHGEACAVRRVTR